MSTGRARRSRTLWEEGRRPGRGVALAAAAATLVVVALDLVVTHRLTVFYDVAFVAICLAAALGVRPRDFFIVGVFPPLLMAATMFAVALVDRSAVAGTNDGIIQAVISGLAHHATALVVGYAFTLATLALRRVALRNAGALRTHLR